MTSWTFKQIAPGLSAIALTLLGTVVPPAIYADPATLSRGPDVRLNGPAMWMIEDEDTELYFFGSVHVLPDELDWRRDEFLDVMNRADIVYFETSTRDAGDNFLQFFQMGMAGPGEGLHDVLNDDQLTLLSETLGEFGLNLESFRGQKPWFASLMIGYAIMDAQGSSAENGVETWMDARLATNRDVRSLEDSLEVARAFSELSTDDQIRMLMDGLESEETTNSGEFDQALWAWMKGDPNSIYRDTIAPIREDQESVYDVMFTRRNANWVNSLEEIMRDEPGTILVVVGAGHLAGPDSVIDMLEARGWEADQF